MKSVKELSEICGVSQQSIRIWCTKHEVKKGTKHQFMIDENTEKEILEYYGKTGQPNTSQSEPEHESARKTQKNAQPSETLQNITQPCKDNDTSQNKQENEEKNELVRLLEKQLDEKQRTIDNLLKINEELSQNYIHLSQKMTELQEKQKEVLTIDDTKIVDIQDEKPQKKWWQFWKKSQ